MKGGQMKRILVTGGNGFIGHHLIKQLKSEGHWVRSVDWVELPTEERPWTTEADDTMILDLAVPGNAEIAVEGIDEVYALAAEQGGIGYVSKKEEQAHILYNNTMVNVNTLHAAMKAGIKKYLYTSSACVYPLFKQEEIDATALKEDDVYPADPDNSYGWEKLQTEHFVKWYSECHDMDVRIVRFHNIYGPEEPFTGLRAKAPGAITRKIHEAIKDGSKEIEVWGDGTQRRSYCYIDDCIKSIRLVMEQGVSGQAYNIGRDDSVSIKELADMLIELSGEDIKVNYIPEHYAKGVMGRNCDTTLFKETFDYEADTEMKEGLVPLFNWIKSKL